MTELKGTKIIAIDHGYGNIKTANTVTPTAITAYDSPPVFTGNILEYEGRWYRIGEGHKEFTPDKAIDEDYYLLTLMAIARELNQEHITEAYVHIACGLPLRWVSTQRETFREYMLKKKSVRFKFNGTEYRIRITGCTVFPQGYAGMSPSTYQSGQLTSSYSHMEKRGSRYLRYALFNATRFVCLWDETFAKYLAKKRSEGKHYNVAVTHAAKKLVRLMFHLMTTGEAYAPVA